MCLIAKLDIENYQVPRDIFDQLLEKDSGTVVRIPNEFGAEFWLHCWEAPRHTDHVIFPNKFFLTLVLASEHIFYESCRDEGIKVKKGDIFIVNSEIPHWLYPEDSEKMLEDNDSLGFVCVQWDIRNDRRAAYNIRDIIDEIGAEFIEIQDNRYTFLTEGLNNFGAIEGTDGFDLRAAKNKGWI